MPNRIITVRKTTLEAERLSSVDPSHADPGYVDGTPEERVLLMWPLTLNVWAFTKDNKHAESRLQRHVAVLTRGEG